MATLTDSDEGKDVIGSNGDTIGVVREVDDHTAHVDPDPGVTDELKSVLGWGDEDGDTYPLAEDEVESVTDDEVRLDRTR